MTTRTNRRQVMRGLLAGCGSAILGPAHAHQDSVSREREILIRGGRVVNSDGSRTADVRVVGETIAEIGSNLRPGRDSRTIDAGGKLVMPGGIDPHTHLHGSFADDLTTGSQAALAGGITTVGTFANPQPDEDAIKALQRERTRAATEAICDVFFHVSGWPPSPATIASLPELASRKQPSIKVYMPSRNFHTEMSGFIELLEAARRAGVVTMAHCEDSAFLAAAVRRLTAANQTSLEHYSESRPVIAEVAGTQLAAALVESTGAPIYVVHLSCARALEATRAPRRLKLPLYVETRPMYLHLTDEKLKGPDAPLFVGQPPLRSREDSEALWTGLLNGAIDVLATDHAPWTRAQKLDPGRNISRPLPGVSDLQFMLPMYFSDGRKRSLSLERFVATTSTNAARIFGLYPMKGVIREQAAADIVIWDPKVERAVRAEDDLSRADYSVYEGRLVTGWPIITIRRGEIVYENGRVTGLPGTGRVIDRQPWEESSAR